MTVCRFCSIINLEIGIYFFEKGALTMMTLENIVVILLVSLGLSIYGLISFRKKAMEEKELLLTLTKRFSIILLVVNLFILSLFSVVPYMASVVIPNVNVSLGIFFYSFVAGAYAAGASAIFGPAIGLAGIVLSIYNKRAQNKHGVGYIIASVIAASISVMFLVTIVKPMILAALV